MLDVNSLPTQFSTVADIKATLSPMCHGWFDGFHSGKLPDRAILEQIPAYRATWFAYCEFAGISVAKFQRNGLAREIHKLNRKHGKERYALIQAFAGVTIPLPQNLVDAIIRSAYQNVMQDDTATAKSIIEQHTGDNADLANKVRTSKQVKKVVKAVRAAASEEGHKLMDNTLGKKIHHNAVVQDTVGKTVSSILASKILARNIESQRQELEVMKARLAALEAAQQQQAARNATDDAGDWKEKAKELRAQGKSFAAIAREVGRSKAHVARLFSYVS
ncbi:helix-turn-helix domain-containing protein [Pectobacterium colocasium]|uniref:helix-turn-helix domain-containing protein n=1 Tax=Pectobacterium TaxID=122277 RepID=UPI000B7BE98F|nr:MULTISPECIES: helix-turn-helix domain-containing protein [Pectobacterium]ASN87073.1 Putative transposase [Pectobacterium versatile]MCL6366763.1 helix-turn-helix domain-containing protein [Pectobacterium carotovorum subsp. carotovorum]MCL6400115.1 helix-turn-helix domain-containing protein [Pectobacterium carotovorum subsp. carotovorum]MDE8742727.1 helix-turn-helix domain-containing protein [Pectobacterium polaris]